MENIDYERLAVAVSLLEHPGWPAKVMDLIERPIKWAVAQLPPAASHLMSASPTKAIQKALEAAVLLMKRDRRGTPQNWWHRSAVAASGGISGINLFHPATT
jgi:hypothetical protein